MLETNDEWTVARRYMGYMGLSISPEHGNRGCGNRISGWPTGGSRGKAPPALVS